MRSHRPDAERYGRGRRRYPREMPCRLPSFSDSSVTQTNTRRNVTAGTQLTPSRTLRQSCATNISRSKTAGSSPPRRTASICSNAKASKHPRGRSTSFGQPSTTWRRGLCGPRMLRYVAWKSLHRALLTFTCVASTGQTIAGKSRPAGEDGQSTLKAPPGSSLCPEPVP